MIVVSTGLIDLFPGMSVCWHPSESGKLLVAQKSGIISLFNSSNYSPILSLDCGGSPLLGADWCLANSSLVAAAVFSEIVFFDLTKPSLPTERRSLHADGSRSVCFSRSADTLVATIGKPGATLKVSFRNSGTIAGNAPQVRERERERERSMDLNKIKELYKRS